MNEKSEFIDKNEVLKKIKDKSLEYLDAQNEGDKDKIQSIVNETEDLFLDQMLADEADDLSKDTIKKLNKKKLD